MSHTRETLLRLKNGEIPVDFDWNTVEHDNYPVETGAPEPGVEQLLKVKIRDEALRDGLHGVEIYPDHGKLMEYVRAARAFGIKEMTVGIFPGKGNKVDQTIRKLLANMRDETPDVSPLVLCLATEPSLDWLGECKQINPRLKSIVFMGTAPFRMMVQRWTPDFVLKQLSSSIETATHKHGVEVVAGTEHTTQTPPAFLEQIVKAQINSGAKTFCIADTIGIARPRGAYRIVKAVKKILNEMGMGHIPVEWHGHEDMGNGLSNAMAAIAAGAEFIHTVPRGRGERAGNTALEGVVLNVSAMLKEQGFSPLWQNKLLTKVGETYDMVVGQKAPQHGPLGERSHHTTLGIHGDGMIKAMELAALAVEDSDLDLAAQLETMSQQIYSAVNPTTYGKEHKVSIGPWSGKSNVQLAYMLMGRDPENLTAEQVQRVLDVAKDFGRELTQEELHNLLG